LQALLKSSTSGVREIVDGVVDGKPGGLSQVSNATYDILEKATGPALSFVATQVGMENVRKELQNILENKLDLRSYVYVAAYKLAEKAKSFAGFGQLLPAPLSAKIPLADGQNLWEMKGKDGKAELVIGDPQKVNKKNAAVQAADNLANQEIAAITQLKAAIEAIKQKKPPTRQDGRNLDELTREVARLEQADTAAVIAATSSIQTAAPNEGPYSHLSDRTKVEPGRMFQHQQKEKILEANRQRNGGKLMSDDPNDSWFGKELQGPGPRRFAGDTVPPNEAQIDHIVPRIGPDGKLLGTNSYSNARVISAEYNNFLRNKKS
jgi:hypothetical protein